VSISPLPSRQSSLRLSRLSHADSDAEIALALQRCVCDVLAAIRAGESA
jgi:hypothetical protein